MATATKKLENFIAGKSVPTTGDGRTRCATRRPARSSPRWGSRLRPTSTPRSRRPARRSTAGRRRRPPSAASRCCGSPTRSRSTATSSPRSRPRTPASRWPRYSSDEIPPWSTDLRFFAGAARCMEGRAAGEYLEGYTSIDPPRAGRRRRPDQRRGTTRCMMASGSSAPALATGNTIVLKPAETTPTRRRLARRAAAEYLPEGVFNVVTGGRRSGEQLVTPRRRRHGLAHRLGASRARGRRSRRADRSSACTSSSAARRRSSSSTTSTWRPRSRRSPAPGYYNAGQDCTAATRVLAGPGSTTTFVEAVWPSRPRASSIGDPLRRRHHARPAELSPPARARRGLPRAQARPREGRHRRGSEPDLPGFFLEPTVVARPRAGRRDDPARDLRPGHHRPAVHRRGRRRSPGRTAPSTAWPRRSGRATSAARCAWPRPCASAACGSTTTSRSSPRCRMAASSSPATARTSRCTPFEDYTRRSST